MAAAHAPGDEVQGFENEYTDVVQNADGSYTAEIHSVPVNFRNARGEWKPIDTRLVPAAGGWRNSAGPYRVSFAGPGAPPSQDLVTISDGKRTLGFGAASQSPLAAAPIVIGNTISYPDVYPGVSLLYTLERNELKEEVVLTQKPAAAPRLRFQLSLVGLTARTRPTGEIAFEDEGGKAPFTIPRLTMVDSAGPQGSREGEKTDAIDYELATVNGRQTLTISPSWDWLRDSRRVYPVYVDPVVNLTPSTGTFIRSDLSTPQSGATTYESGYQTVGHKISRTLVTFNLQSLQGVTVSSATLSAWESWSASCTASQVDTYQITSSWNSSVIWATQPTIAAAPLGSALAAQGFSAACPAKRITLADLTTAVQNWQSGSWVNNGVELRAASESDPNGFKKFASDVSLFVVYNVTLSPPTNLSPADGTLSTSTTPTLSGTYSGPGPGGYLEFEVRRSSDGVIVSTGSGGVVAPGGTSSWVVPSGQLVSGNAYQWRARSRSSNDASAWTASRTYIADQAPTGSLDSPIQGAVVDSLNPVLRINASDPDGNQMYMQFQVSTTANFSNITADSGWMPTTWTYSVPDGALTNDIRSTTGVTHYWRTRAKDTLGATTPWVGTDFKVKLSLTGVGGNWPTFTRGPLSVNEATGNLVVQAPGPSYPTIIGSMGVAPTFNSFDTADIGLGPGWSLGILDLRGAATKLIDHSQLTGTAKQDSVELVGPHGDKRWFKHVSNTAIYTPPHGESGAVLTKNGDGTWTLTDGGTIATYSTVVSAIAKLTSIQDAAADPGLGTMTYAFLPGSNDKVQTITDPGGRTLTLTWNSANPGGCPSPAALCVTGPDGVTWKYWVSGGKLSGVWNGTRDLVAYTYYENGRLGAVKNANDLNPAGASPGYDGTHQLGIAYDSPGKVVAVADGPIHSQPAGQQTSIWTFSYLGTANLAPTATAHTGMAQGTVRQASGRTEITPPTQQGLPTPKKTIVYYDGQGQPMQVTDILGTITKSHFDSGGGLSWAEDADGNPVDNTWDDVNDVLLETQGPDPDGAGGPLGRPETTYRYDEKAIGTASQAGPALQGLQASYFANFNLAGRPAARQTDGTVDFSWGTGGPAALGSQVDNFSVRWNGNVNVATEGDYTLTVVSDEGVRLSVDGIQALHNWQDQTATAVSSLPVHLTAGLHPITLDYYEKTGPAEVHLRWSCAACSPAIADQVIPASALVPAWNNQTSTVSPLGKVAFSHVANPAKGLSDYSLVKDGGTNVITSFAYDAYGRLTQKVMPKGNASRTIDADGTLLGSPDPAYATSFVYYTVSETAAPPGACGGGSAVNQAGLLKSKTPYGIATTSSVYNSRGELIASTNDAGTSCSTFTSEGRLSSTKAPGESQSTTYTYDPAGALRTATDASGTLTTEYDEAGRVIRSVDSFGAEATFSYDKHGNPTQRQAKATSTGTNYSTSYAYDDADRLTSLTDPAGRVYGFFYDSRSNLKATQYPNGTFSWSDFNAAGWQTALYNRHGALSAPLPANVPADASPLADYAYSYELEGRKTQEVRTGGDLPTETSAYFYDDLGRLSQVTLPDGTVRVYSFDLDSNRTSIVENSQTVATYAYDPNKLDLLQSVTEGQTRTFSYDSDGNTTSRGSDSLSWDGRGRHSGGTFGGTTLTYGFDAGGFRRTRTGAAATTHYRLGGLYETNTTGTILNTDAAGPAGDLARYAGPPTTGSTVSFLYYNGHGDLADEANTSGTRTAAYSYDPFGALRSGSAPANATSERWTSRHDKKLDSASSLVEMGARPYDPVIGRFLSLDPIDGGSLNGCDFAGQDPINNADPSGLFSCEVTYSISRSGDTLTFKARFSINTNFFEDARFYSYVGTWGASSVGGEVVAGGTKKAAVLWRKLLGVPYYPGVTSFSFSVDIALPDEDWAGVINVAVNVIGQGFSVIPPAQIFCKYSNLLSIFTSPDFSTIRKVW